MLPFLSTADALFALGVVSGVVALGGVVYSLAWRQRPAMVASKAAAAPAPVKAAEAPMAARV